jgi:hypothetical protein
VFSPPAEARYLGWYTAAHGYDGFLRWAYDAWAADPSAMLGTCCGPQATPSSCIPEVRAASASRGCARHRRFREDQAPAKLGLSSTDGDVKRLASDLEQALSAVASDRDFDEAPLRANLAKGTRALVALSDQLTRGRRYFSIV